MRRHYRNDVRTVLTQYLLFLSSIKVILKGQKAANIKYLHFSKSGQNHPDDAVPLTIEKKTIQIF